MLAMQRNESRSLEEANTGTLAHVSIAEWIKTGSIAEGVRAAKESQAKFLEAEEAPGDIEAAQKWLAQYAKDPRNAPLGEWPKDRSIGRVDYVEERVGLVITLGEKEVCITGTLDQARRKEDGKLYVWDIKTSLYLPDREAWHIYWSYFNQLFGYTKGLEFTLRESNKTDTVELGGLILPRSYTARNETRKEVFYRGPHLKRSCHATLLESIAEEIIAIRSGVITPSISVACNQCYVTQGPNECMALLQEIIDNA